MQTELAESNLQSVALLQVTAVVNVAQSWDTSEPEPRSLEYLVKNTKKRKSSACTAMAPRPKSRRCWLEAMVAAVQTFTAKKYRDARIYSPGWR